MSVSGNDFDDEDFDDLAEFDDEPVQEDEPEVDEPDLEAAFVETEQEAPVALSTRRSKGEKTLPLIDVEGTPDSEAIRRPLISGHCNFPGVDKKASHARCADHSRANPDKIFQPCPCTCHFPEDRYECDACGGTLVEAPHYPLDEDGDVRYVHYDPTTRRITRAACG